MSAVSVVAAVLQMVLTAPERVWQRETTWISRAMTAPVNAVERLLQIA